MKQNKNTYPNYVSGQYLTSENLNDSFSYLDEQSRLTRANLIGTGIIDGLGYSWQKDTNDNMCLTIESGEAISANGYYVQFQKEISSPEYKYWKKEDEGSKDNVAYVLYRDNPDKDKKIVLIEKFDPYKYVLGLRVQAQQNNQTICNHSTCDINDSHTKILCCPVLFEIEKAQKIEPKYNKLNFVQIKGSPRIVENMEFLKGQIAACFKNNILEIANFLLQLLKDSRNIISTNNINLLSESQHLLLNTYKISDVKPYYLLFCEDLKMAINEYVEYFNNFILNYVSEPKENVVILGTGALLTDTDPYREMFRSLHLDQQSIDDKTILDRLWLRIDAMIRAFGYVGGDIKLIPSKGPGSKLGERPIPSYYRYDTKTSNFADLWQAHRLIPISIYEYQTFQPDSLLDAHGCAFYRIEGHYGKDTNTIYTTIKNLIGKYQLPIDICKLERVNTTSISSKADMFYYFSSVIKGNYENSTDSQIVSYGKVINFTDLKVKCLDLNTYINANQTINDSGVTGFGYNNTKSYYLKLISILPQLKSFVLMLKRLNAQEYTLINLEYQQLVSFVDVYSKLQTMRAGIDYLGGVNSNSTIALVYSPSRIAYFQGSKKISGNIPDFFMDICIPINVVQNNVLKFTDLIGDASSSSSQTQGIGSPAEEPKNDSVMPLTSEELAKVNLINKQIARSKYVPTDEEQKLIERQKAAFKMPFLCPIEDVFFVTGRGTVVSGRVETGRIKSGTAVEIIGFGKTFKTRVLGLEVFKKTLDEVEMGDNVGILLDGIKKDEIKRGMVVAIPGTIKSHLNFTAVVDIYSKEEGGRSLPFKNEYRPQFYFRTTDVTGVITLEGGISEVVPGTKNLTISVKMVSGLAMSVGTNFTIREEGRTVGTGRVAKLLD